MSFLSQRTACLAKTHAARMGARTMRAPVAAGARMFSQSAPAHEGVSFGLSDDQQAYQELALSLIHI